MYSMKYDNGIINHLEDDDKTATKVSSSRRASPFNPLSCEVLLFASVAQSLLHNLSVAT